MKNWTRVLVCMAALDCNVLPALANFAMSPSGSTTLFAVDAANQGTSLCAAASTECAAHILINTAGAPIGVAATPLQVSLANTAANGTAIKVDGSAVTQPISGSIGNTTFAATQATAANLNATVVGTGTFSTQLTGATNNINNIAGTITLPTGASAEHATTSGADTVSNTLTGQQTYSRLQMYNGTSWDRLIGDTTSGIWVNIKAGAGSGGTAIADNAAFTQGTTNETPMGCYFLNGTYSPITAGHVGVVSCTSVGSLHTTVDNSTTAIPNNADAIAVQTGAANSPVNNYNYGFNGTSWDRLQVDGSKQLKIVAATTTNAGAATVKGGVGVVNGGSFYQAIAASQTATVLQSSTGAAGDYLSHCDIYPTSTSPGVVTVFDNTNTAANSTILFAGGATSLSNLAPIPVPVGAVSINGAWKVTTGANVSVACFGKFS